VVKFIRHGRNSRFGFKVLPNLSLVSKVLFRFTLQFRFTSADILMHRTATGQKLLNTTILQVAKTVLSKGTELNVHGTLSRFVSASSVQ